MNTKENTKVSVTKSGNVWTMFKGCLICEKADVKGVQPSINHDSCIYFDNPRYAVGHKQKGGHCTADACC